MAESPDEELRRRRQKRLVKGLMLGGAAVGVPALANLLVSRRARSLPDATWGSGGHFRWRGVDVACQRLGEGRPVVLVHSLGPGHSSAEWRRAAETLAKSFELIAPDLPGWGQSTPADLEWNGELYVDFLAFLLEEVVDGEEAPLLVASGLSAAYAVRLAAERPELLAALALVCPQGLELYAAEPGLKENVLHGLLDSPILGTSALNLYTSRSALATYLRREVYASADLVDDALIDLHYTNSHRPGAQEALAAYVSGHLNLGVAGVIGDVAVPAWIGWGRRAPSPSVERADLWLLRLAPETELEVFEQAGILPHAESPEEFGRKLESWIHELDL